MTRVDLSFILTLDRRKSAAPSLRSPKGRLVRCGLVAGAWWCSAWLQRVLLRGARGRRRAARLFRDLWNPAHLFFFFDVVRARIRAGFPKWIRR